MGSRNREQLDKNAANALCLKIDSNTEFAVIHARMNFRMIFRKDQFTDLWLIAMNDALAHDHRICLLGFGTDTRTGFDGNNLYTSFHDNFSFGRSRELKE